MPDANIPLNAVEIDLILHMFDSVSNFQESIKSILKNDDNLINLNKFMEDHIKSIVLRKSKKEEYIMIEVERKSTIKVLNKAKELKDSLGSQIKPFISFKAYLDGIIGPEKGNIAFLVSGLIINTQSTINKSNELIEQLAEYSFE